MDGGTLYQLRNLINRRNVVKDPSSNVTACEDFFLHVVEAHIVTACMTTFGMSSVDDSPSTDLFPDASDELDPEQRKAVLMLAIQEVMDECVDLSLEPQERQCDDDGVFAYACDVLSLGLLYMEFSDAIREGDGERIIRCWRYLLLIFKATGRTNYSVEAFTLLAQYHFIFTERMQMQLQWSRTVNVRGRPAKNIPCDLHNEHLNRECKGSISGLGANLTEHAIERVGRSLRLSTRILQHFDELQGIPIQSGHHAIRSSAADFAKLVEQLHDSKVFHLFDGRAHRTFPNHSKNVIKQLSRSSLLQWFQERLQKLLIYR